MNKNSPQNSTLCSFVMNIEHSGQTSVNADDKLQAYSIDDSPLLAINDDCLEIICGYLSTLEQFQLTLVNARFQSIVARLYRLNLRRLQLTNDDVKDLTNADYLQLMELVSPHVEHIEFHYVQRRKFLLLSQCCFPKVHTLVITDPFERTRCVRHRYPVEIVEIIRHSFPHMHTLKANGFRLAYGSHFTSISNIKILKMQFL